MAKLSAKEVTKLMNDCVSAGGEVEEADFQEYLFYAPSAPSFLAKFNGGKIVSLRLVTSAQGAAITPPIKVSAAQARALSDLG